MNPPLTHARHGSPKRHQKMARAVRAFLRFGAIPTLWLWNTLSAMVLHR